MQLPFTQRTRVIAGAIAVGVLVLVVTVFGDEAVSNRIAAARAVSTVALKQVAVAQKTADSALKVAAAERDSVAAAAHVAAVAKTRADSAQHAADHFRGALSQIVKVAPDTCKPIIVTADSALAADSASIRALHTAAVADSTQIAVLTDSRDSLTSALVTLRTASKALVSADKQLAKAAKPSLLLRLLPHPGVNITGGVDRHGKLNAVAGISAGWSF